MAIDPRIALAGRELKTAQAGMRGLQQGFQFAETASTADVRKQILEQEAQQGQFTQAQQKGQYLNQLATGLMNKPLDQRAAVVAQQLPFLTQLGMNPAEILGQDLTNQGLQSVISQTQPFMQQSQTQPKLTGVTDISLKDFTADSVQAFMDSGQKDFSLLERVEAWKTTSLPDGTKVQINSATGEVRFPTVEGDAQQAPQQAPQQARAPQDVTQQPAPQVLTPQAQQELKTVAKAQEAAAVAEAKAGVAAQDPELLETQRKGNQVSQDTIRVIDEMLSSDRLDDITGLTGRFPTLKPKTQDLLNSVQQLSSLLTSENMDIMTGVLSESDIGIIRGIAQDLGFDFDNKGNVTRLTGSLEGTQKKLKRIKQQIITGLNTKGYYVEGQTASTPDGVRIRYNGTDWVDQNGNIVR